MSELPSVRYTLRRCVKVLRGHELSGQYDTVEEGGLCAFVPGRTLRVGSPLGERTARTAYAVLAPTAAPETGYRLILQDGSTFVVEVLGSSECGHFCHLVEAA